MQKFKLRTILENRGRCGLKKKGNQEDTGTFIGDTGNTVGQLGLPGLHSKPTGDTGNSTENPNQAQKQSQTLT